MNKPLNNPLAVGVDDSPFHNGEQAIQTRLGVRERMERFGRQVVRDHMPEQHRQFYNQLPFVLVGHADADGWPWASILMGNPGFVVSHSPTSLSIKAQPLAGDPLADFLPYAAEHSGPLGLLGIELETRRRNRLSARVTDVSDGRIELSIDQAFGNCPQYIQTRRMVPVKRSAASRSDIEVLDETARALIEGSDTFFVASYTASHGPRFSHGVDVSHRGGRPGFIRVDDERTLTIPDYLGNFHFNTLGNFLENPKAGLLFIDFERGHVLSLTGTVEILWDSPETVAFRGAERLWQFHLVRGVWLYNVLPAQWAFGEYSVDTTLTGTWAEVEQVKQAGRCRDRSLPYEVIDIVEESSVIKSFYLKALENHRPEFQAGQFLTVKANVGEGTATRTYTVSSAPHDSHFRISVKHEQHLDSAIPDGVFSSFLHRQVCVGNTLQIKTPAGDFVINPAIDRPALLISGGVGITPMVSMARHVLMEGLRTRHLRPLTLICAARNRAQRAFFEELNDLARQSSGLIRVFWVLDDPEPTLKPGCDFHHKGGLSKELLQAVLPLDDYDAYLCGPKGFMQFSYELLRELGLNDNRIYAESFGPASLQRSPSENEATKEQPPAAEQATVVFTESKVELNWRMGDGSLLELAEQHGLAPEYSCRAGRCGSCKVKLVFGCVIHSQRLAEGLSHDEVLLCCAEPANADNSDGVSRIGIGA